MPATRLLPPAALLLALAGPAAAGEARVAYRQVAEPPVCDDYSWVQRSLDKAPAFRSEKVRYNIWVLGDGRKSVMTMAWDESRGTGTGYDTLYVDRNFNRDLTEAGEQLKLIAQDKDCKHAYPPLEGIKEADGDKVFNLKLAGWYGDYTIGYPSSYTATGPGHWLGVGPLPGDVRLAWANELAKAPIYRLGGKLVWFLNDRLPGSELGPWTAGDTATVMWYGALLGERPGLQLRTPTDGKLTLLRVLDTSGATLEDIPFDGHCTCGGGFTTTLLIPTRVPPGRHLIVGRVAETRTEYLYPVQISNPEHGKPIQDPALTSLRAKFPGKEVRFAALRRVGSSRQDALPGHPDEVVVAAQVADNTLTPRHLEGGQRENNNGTEPYLRLSASGFIKYEAPLSALLKVDLAGIPRQTRILGAQLRLTMIANQFVATGGKSRLEAYAVRRPWNEVPGPDGYSCWLGPKCVAKGDPSKAWIVSGEAWGAPACEDTEKDRFPEIAGSVEVGAFPGTPPERRRMISLDLTTVVQRWHAGELPNHGLLLKSTWGSLDLASSEFAVDRPAFRPTLVIAYEGPPPTGSLTLRPDEDLARARAAAAQHKRPLAVRFTSARCQTCQEVERTTLANREVAELLRGRFVGATLAAEAFPTEVAEFAVGDLPTLVLLQADGRTVLAKLGAATLLDAKATKAALEAALK